nr:B-cell differentiation antigen CD72-like isoform X1 [Pogona vitticeps]
MSQEGVTYADLRFVRSPLEKKSPPREPGGGGGEGDGELTYENVEGPQLRRGEERLEEEEAAARRSSSSGRAPKLGRRSWFAASALLGTCLLLLGTTVGLGVRYWQVSQQLQQASQDHTVESVVLAERIGTKERQLQEAKAQLRSTREALQDWEAAGSRMQEQLQKREKELSRARDNLDLLMKEKLQEQQKREESEQELNEMRRQLQEVQSRPQPNKWTLFGCKCLWISSEQKTWRESKEDCEKKESQLLTLRDPSDTERLWEILPSVEQTHHFWIGLQKRNYYWFWVDDSWASWTETPKQCTTDRDGNCAQMSRGTREGCHCSTRHRYICEKAAGAAQADHTFPWC